ncbi:MAG TPA: phage baseplate assembly protein V, partial [Gemmatirosa sp.]
AHVLRGREVERVEVTEQMGAHTVCRLTFDRDPSAPTRAAATLRVAELTNAPVLVTLVGGAPPSGDEGAADGDGGDGSAEPAPVFSGEVRWVQETHLPSGSSRLVVLAASRSWQWDAYAEYRAYPKQDLASLARTLDVTVERLPPGAAAPLTLMQWGESDWAFLARFAAQHGAYLAPTADGIALRTGFAGEAHELVWGQNLIRLASMLTPTNHGVKGAAYQADGNSPKHDHRFNGIRQTPDWTGGAAALVTAVSDAAQDAEGGGDPTSVAVPSRAPTLADAREALARESARRLGESVWVTGQSLDPAVRAGGKVDVRAATGGAAPGGGPSDAGAPDWTLDVEGVLGVVRVVHVWADGLYRNEFAATPWAGYVPPVPRGRAASLASAQGSGGSTAAPVTGSGSASLGRRPLATGVVPALVTANVDASGQGRVRVRYAWMAPDAPGVWARVALPYAGHTRGVGWVPEVGDEVVVAHVAADPERPVVVGAVHNGREHALHGPGRKQLLTLAGHALTFVEGGPAGPGHAATPAVLELHTPGGRALLRMENAVGAPPRVTLHSDGDLELHAPAGQVRITARDVVTHVSGVHATAVGGTHTVVAQGGATTTRAAHVHLKAGTEAAVVGGTTLHTHAGTEHRHTGAP